MTVRAMTTSPSRTLGRPSAPSGGERNALVGGDDLAVAVVDQEPHPRRGRIVSKPCLGSRQWGDVQAARESRGLEKAGKHLAATVSRRAAPRWVRELDRHPSDRCAHGDRRTARPTRSHPIQFGMRHARPMYGASANTTVAASVVDEDSGTGTGGRTPVAPPAKSNARSPATTAASTAAARPTRWRC